MLCKSRVQSLFKDSRIYLTCTLYICIFSHRAASFLFNTFLQFDQASKRSINPDFSVRNSPQFLPGYPGAAWKFWEKFVFNLWPLFEVFFWKFGHSEEERNSSSKEGPGSPLLSEELGKAGTITFNKHPAQKVGPRFRGVSTQGSHSRHPNLTLQKLHVLQKRGYLQAARRVVYIRGSL